MNVILIGFMGSGKTTVGKILAEKKLMNFIDLDAEFEREEGRKIVRIFEEKGEDYFRRRESEILKKFAREKNTVLATGGGVVLKGENRDLLEKMGKVFWLDASADTVYENTRHQKYRPLLNREDRREFIVKKLQERKPLYEKLGKRIAVDGKAPETIVDEIEEGLHDG